LASAEFNEGKTEKNRALKSASFVSNSRMKNKLQYAYSITVFLGVLVTAYLMMNREGNARIPMRALQGPSLRTEALVLDPAVNQLFEMEDALSKLPQDKPVNSRQKRSPSDMRQEDRPPSPGNVR
jgi:hypothetical protein